MGRVLKFAFFSIILFILPLEIVSFKKLERKNAGFMFMNRCMPTASSPTTWRTPLNITLKLSSHFVSFKGLTYGSKTKAQHHTLVHFKRIACLFSSETQIICPAPKLK
jgi:hypothetical protein